MSAHERSAGRSRAILTAIRGGLDPANVALQLEAPRLPKPPPTPRPYTGRNDSPAVAENGYGPPPPIKALERAPTLDLAELRRLTSVSLARALDAARAWLVDGDEGGAVAMLAARAELDRVRACMVDALGMAVLADDETRHTYLAVSSALRALVVLAHAGAESAEHTARARASAVPF